MTKEELEEEEKDEDEEEFEQNRIVKYISFVVSAVFIVLFIIFNHFYSSWLIEYRYSVILPISVAVYLFLSYPIWINAYRSLRYEHEIFNEDTLIIVASLSAFVIAYIQDNENNYNLSTIYEALIVNLLFLIGEAFEDYAKDKSKDEIASLVNLTDNKQRLKDNENSFIYKDIDDVEIGEIVYYSVGEKVGLDIQLLSENALVDQSALTGESVPLNKEINEIIYSGSIVLERNIFGRVINNSKDSTISKIAEMIKNSSKSKAKTEKFIHKFAKYYTPIVIIITFLVAILGGILSGNWKFWIYEAASILVVACPCSLVVSIPLAYIIGIGRAAKEGVLIKGGNYLDIIAKSKTIAFDKTGTLTKGELRVSKIDNRSTYKNEEILKIAAELEQNSQHPIAKAILKEAQKYVKITSDITVKETPGVGLSYLSKENDLFEIGNERLLKDQSLNLLESQTYTLLLKNHELIAIIYLEDTLKNNINESITSIKKSGFNHLSIISGDHKDVVNAVANKLDFNSYYAQLTPEEKVAVVNELKNKHGFTLFVGDGINDAPTIAASDCGVSMGIKGSDVAIESSDIVILNDDIEKIAWLKKLSKIVRFIVIFNIVLSLLIKLSIIILSIIPTVNVPLMLSIFGDVGVLIICLINVLLIKKIKIK